MKIALYVTSHGFGHASRVSALTQVLIKYGCDCYIITDRPKFLFPKEGSFCHLIERKTDTGMIQESWKVPSISQTYQELTNLWENKDRIVDLEEDFLKSNSIDLVIVDIPFLPILAAKRSGIPVYAITNFDWYFNYVELVNDQTPSKIKNIINEIKHIYQLCNKSFILPFSNDKSVEALPNQVKCGNLAKSSQANRDEICRQFNIDKSKKLALITFGGIMSDISYFENLTSNKDYVFLTNSPIGQADNIVLLPRDYDYSLLIASCDLVITKVGYSTLAETCAAGTYLCYATRDNFPEDRPLVEELKNYPHSQHFQLLDDKIDISLPKGKIDKYYSPRFSLKNNEIGLAIISSYLQEKSSNLGAVIDFGTNNSTLLIYSLDNDKHQVLYYDIRITGIGLNIDKELINQKSMTKAIRELSIQLDLCKASGIIPHILVTNIGRISKNFNQFEEKINRKYSVIWEVISPNREAKLGVISSLNVDNNNCDFYNLDIGGSSTEISLIKQGEIVELLSLPLGILIYYQRFKDSRYNFEQISEIIQQEIEELINDNDFPIKEGSCIYGVGKVFQNLSCIYEGKTHYEHFYELKNYDLQDFMFTLHDMINHKSKYNYHDYNGKKLNESIFYISLAILQAFNNVLHTNDLVVNPWGLEFGYLIEKENKNEV
jgi:L-arabinokinase